jgi:ribosomal silencing factor RsfS
MDYGDLVVHVFSQDMRDFYDLERLWSNAPRVKPNHEALAKMAAISDVSVG